MRLKCRVEGFQGGAMIIDANELRGLAEGLAQNCVVGPAGLMKWATYWTKSTGTNPKKRPTHANQGPLLARKIHQG
jgi:hypothetical protein